MTRRAARITMVEVERLIAAVQARGLPVIRVTFDGARVDVIVSGDSPAKKPKRSPDSFETLEEYEAWRAEHHGI
jgi:hypothetical protein